MSTMLGKILRIDVDKAGTGELRTLSHGITRSWALPVSSRKYMHQDSGTLHTCPLIPAQVTT